MSTATVAAAAAPGTPATGYSPAAAPVAGAAAAAAHIAVAPPAARRALPRWLDGPGPKTRSVTVTHRCGHTVKRRVTFPPRPVVSQTREEFLAARARSAAKSVCVDCDYAHRAPRVAQEEAGVRADLAVALPAITGGSSRQRAYARDLRENAVRLVRGHARGTGVPSVGQQILASLLATSPLTGGAGQVPTTDPPSASRRNRVASIVRARVGMLCLAEVTSARSWMPNGRRQERDALAAMQAIDDGVLHLAVHLAIVSADRQGGQAELDVACQAHALYDVLAVTDRKTWEVVSEALAQGRSLREALQTAEVLLILTPPVF